MTRNEFADLALAALGEVNAFARRLTRNFSDADDLVQATYERAFASWSALADPRACRSWLFRIARNLLFDQRRATRARPELRLVEPSDHLAPEPVVGPETIERVNARTLEDALERLPADQREAILLCDLWGFTYDEIASITGAPVGTVRSRIARGRARLASIIVAGERAGTEGGRRP